MDGAAIAQFDAKTLPGNAGERDRLASDEIDLGQRVPSRTLDARGQDLPHEAAKDGSRQIERKVFGGVLACPRQGASVHVRPMLNATVGIRLDHAEPVLPPASQPLAKSPSVHGLDGLV